MVAESDHPCFLPPEDQNVKLWRYMDFTKYVSLLVEKQMFFSRADKFDDPYEGATSHANKPLRKIAYGDIPIPEEAFKQASEFNEWARQWVYISCWHMNKHESAAMWKLYAKTDEAVAVQTTYAKLFEVLTKNTYLGLVNYIDYEKDWLPEDNGFWPYVHKRLSFKHEQEVRGVILDIPLTNNGSIDLKATNSEVGRSVSVSIDDLIEAVYISPTAPEWFADLVRSITTKYGHTYDVQHSSLSKEPVF